MELSYDPQNDVLYIRFRGAKIVESDEVAEGVIVDYDVEGRVVGVEILNARKRGIDLNKIVYDSADVLSVVV